MPLKQTLIPTDRFLISLLIRLFHSFTPTKFLLKYICASFDCDGWNTLIPNFYIQQKCITYEDVFIAFNPEIHKTFSEGVILIFIYGAYHLHNLCI